MSEPTIVVVESSNERRVRAVGDDAKIMLGRTTEGVMAVRPMAGIGLVLNVVRNRSVTNTDMLTPQTHLRGKYSQ